MVLTEIYKELSVLWDPEKLSLFKDFASAVIKDTGLCDVEWPLLLNVWMTTLFSAWITRIYEWNYYAQTMKLFGMSNSLWKTLFFKIPKSFCFSRTMLFAHNTNWFAEVLKNNKVLRDLDKRNSSKNSIYNSPWRDGCICRT